MIISAIALRVSSEEVFNTLKKSSIIGNILCFLNTENYFWKPNICKLIQPLFDYMNYGKLIGRFMRIPGNFYFSSLEYSISFGSQVAMI